jgi:molybdopterin-guanine dinucleotide biosynthesis protein B
MVVVIAVVAAGRGRGKTSLIESVTRKLSGKYRVWTVKHVSDSFDTKDKDTWRHLKAGAEGSVALGAGSLVVLRSGVNESVERALDEVPRDVDLVLVEGFKESVLPKILIAQSLNEAEEQLERISNVFAVSGPFADLVANSSVKGVPVLGSDSVTDRVVRMVVDDQAKRLPGIDCEKCGYSSCKEMANAILNGEALLKDCRTLQVSDVVLLMDSKTVYLSEFPKRVVRNVVLGLATSLKGVDLKKTKRIVLELRI